MAIWETILKIKKNIKDQSGICSFISVKMDPEVQITFDKPLNNASFTIDLTTSSNRSSNFLQNDLFSIEQENNTKLTAEDLDLLNLYLPYALLPYFSRIEKKCYSISHFAQTLDGRIASFSGDSKWIGNEENLIHAHRMRALCDAILIGSKTLHADDPRLNVRLVKGIDPIKVVIGGDSLTTKEYQAYDDNTITFCQNHSDQAIAGEKIVIDKKVGYDTQTILECLYQREIHSVYIEGGAFTTSNFLKEGSIDQVQLHISPKILGSGTNAFAFEGVLNMDQAITFSHGKFMHMGNDVMFVGNLA